jgi:hypothetical protein
MIRGGYYSSAETTTLQGLSLFPGKVNSLLISCLFYWHDFAVSFDVCPDLDVFHYIQAWYPCCIFGNIDICSQRPKGYDQPQNLVHYCEGSFRRPIKVTNVEPRFARRTGGATITVTGENFGLTGSEPIVRINGRQCQKSYFPTSTNLNNLDSHGVPMLLSVATNNLDSSGITSFGSTGFQATGATIGNPAGNALVNAFNAASDSFKSIYPEHWFVSSYSEQLDLSFEVFH